MKTTPLSFLFFYLTFITFFSVELKAQPQKDSLKMYYYRIWRPDSIKHVSLEKAISFYKRKFEVSNNNNDVKTSIYDLRTITAGYIMQSNYFEGEIHAVKALQLLDKNQLDSFSRVEKSRFSTELGRIYWSLKNYKQAVKYYNEALKLSVNVKDQISNHNNIGLVYLEWKKFNEARKSLSIAYEKAMSINDTINQWTISNNIGFTEFNIDKYKGLEKMSNARVKMLGNKSGLRDLFANTCYLAAYHTHHGDIQKAESFISFGIKIADSIKNPLFKRKILGLKAQTHNDSGIREYQRLNDSISFAEKQIEHKYTSQKYNYEKAENDRIKAELATSKANYKTNLWRMAGGLVILASIFLFFYYRQRNRIEKDRERHRTEQKLSKKVHDEVGNDLFYLMTQVQSSPHEFLEQNGLKLLDGLNEIYGKARDISKHYTAVHTGPNYNNELLSLLNSYGSDQVKIIINKIDTDFWESIAPHKKENLYRVLQELLTNMKKHSEASFVAITFSKDSQNMHIKYVDNGCGVDLNALTLKNGLSNVESRMATLKGSITFESKPNKGFKAFIKLSI